VLIHRHEQHRPSSTGKMIGRAVGGAVCHTYQRATRDDAATGVPAASLDPNRDVWILHPAGEPMPAGGEAGDAVPLSGMQILLLDGSWRQAGELLRAVEGRGRCVRLPDATAEPSRYWLRDQPLSTHVSTAEALMAVFQVAREPQAAEHLRLHFELHVYATLLARGRREMAERYLGHSPLLTEAPDVLDRLHTRKTSLRSCDEDSQARLPLP
jgi:DTW domain-containing protein YfiP